MTTTTEPDDLEARLAAAKAETAAVERELSRIEADRVADAREAERIQNFDFIARFKQLEEAEMERERTADSQFGDAVRSRDLQAAAAAWSDARSTHAARRALRNEYNRVRTREQVATGNDVPDFRYRPVDFLSRFEEGLERAADIDGVERADDLIGEPGTDE